jgi:hypothetical protein
MKLLSVSKRGTRLGKYSEFLSFFSDLSAGSHAEIHYNPLTAADEKIPLSVVLVNKKPQHIVFCLFLGHPLSKHWQIACGKLQAALRDAALRLFAVASNSVQVSLAGGLPTTLPSLALAGAEARRRNGALWGTEAVEMWRFGDGLPRLFRPGYRRMIDVLPKCGVD